MIRSGSVLFSHFEAPCLYMYAMEVLMCVWTGRIGTDFWKFGDMTWLRAFKSLTVTHSVNPGLVDTVH